ECCLLLSNAPYRPIEQLPSACRNHQKTTTDHPSKKTTPRRQRVSSGGTRCRRLQLHIHLSRRTVSAAAPAPLYLPCSCACGSVVEESGHRELLEAKGTYDQLWRQHVSELVD